jgi:hypothetical protein
MKVDRQRDRRTAMRMKIGERNHENWERSAFEPEGNKEKCGHKKVMF